MIKYLLNCKNCNLEFESWFASSKEFDKLKKLKLGTMACDISDKNDFKNRNVVKVSTENKLNSNNSPIAKNFTE